MNQNEYEQLQQNVVKILSIKRFNGRYKEIVNDINDLKDISNQCNLQEISFSEVLHQTRFLKGKYGEELKDIIQQYNEIIFPDFTYKNDLNTIINGANSLRLWLIRYLCLKVLKTTLYDLINEDYSSFSITQQYQQIDQVIFNEFLNVKV